MRNGPPPTAPLLAAIEPLAAYVARTPAGNAHADRVAAAVDAVADYVEETEAENATPPGPDWQHIVDRILAYLTPEQPLTPLMARTRAHLDQPHLKARAARPLVERMAAERICSHHLGTPDPF